MSNIDVVTSDITALTIAGFDPSSGAGITADLATFAAHGIFGISAITALTVQSTLGVYGVHVANPEVLRDTLDRLEDDMSPTAIKIGMLAEAAVVHVVADYLERIRHRKPIVVLDPVLRSSSGAVLLNTYGQTALKERLLPLVTITTPNVDELCILSGMNCDSRQNIETGARSLQQRYSLASVIVTGGHLDPPDDLLLQHDQPRWVAGQRLLTNATHGTGCAFSSALLCGLVRGEDVMTALRNAKHYVAEAIRTAVPRGKGKGPLNLLWPLQQKLQPRA